MVVDVVDLGQFYRTVLGKAASASIVREVEKCVGEVPNGTIVGIGFPIPILNALKIDDAICLMPARQGAMQWPQGEASKTVLVDENELPIPNASVDLLIVSHLLENVADPAQTLEEVWRVLAPEGRIVIVTSHRSGPWARLEHTPFGNGQPFSKRQLREMLRVAKLTSIQWTSALHFPPFRSSGMLKFALRFESIARRLWPAFCGVIIVEASKRLYQGIPVSSKKRGKVLVPALSPQGLSRLDKEHSQK